MPRFAINFMEYPGFSVWVGLLCRIYLSMCSSALRRGALGSINHSLEGILHLENQKDRKDCAPDDVPILPYRKGKHRVDVQRALVGVVVRTSPESHAPLERNVDKICHSILGHLGQFFGARSPPVAHCPWLGPAANMTRAASATKINPLVRSSHVSTLFSSKQMWLKGLTVAIDRKLALGNPAALRRRKWNGAQEPLVELQAAANQHITNRYGESGA